ncbi:MAG: TlyA family RNA methyltransferase [Thermodesulfobacteriota bacterium]
MNAKEGKERASGKKRLDAVLVERGLVETRARARAVIMAGDVYVDGVRTDKAGALVKEGSEIAVKDTSLKYVSRGGIKLEAALKEFRIDPEGEIAVDIGASTGGFADCLLRSGAAKVYAVDVGYGQLDWKLRQDPRVIIREKLNARYIKPEDICEPADIVVIDVSFISLTMIIPPTLALLKSGGVLIALIKPQFEVGKGEVGKGGIVRDEAKYREVIDKITEFVKSLGVSVLGVIQSPIEGAEGNKEFLIAAVKGNED